MNTQEQNWERKISLLIGFLVNHRKTHRFKSGVDYELQVSCMFTTQYAWTVLPTPYFIRITKGLLNPSRLKLFLKKSF